MGVNQTKKFMITRGRRPIVVPLIIIINVVVFLLWWKDLAAGQNLNGFMGQNFLVSWTALQEGRYWVLVTSVFSHNLFLHIFINMFVLKDFGGFMEMGMGHMRFLLFYLIAGIVGSISHACVSNFLLGQPSQPALGASGAVAGTIVLFSFLFPKEKILLLGLIPLPAIFGALAFIGLDIWGLIAQTQGGGLPIGHGAHLGGSLVGIVYFLVWFHGKSQRIARARI